MTLFSGLEGGLAGALREGYNSVSLQTKGLSQVYFIAMTHLDEIKQPVADAVADFHKRFDSLLSSRSPWLADACRHLSSSSGKQVRPILTSLVAGLLCGSLPEHTVQAGVCLELIHTATLIHDDVIDEAHTRRGAKTLGALYDNRVAVLMGDFVLSSALLGSLAIGNLEVMAAIATVGRDLSEGEIRQYETAQGAVLDEEVYMEVIDKKTATLFRSCAEVAAITAYAGEEDIEAMSRVGQLLGLAFQIRDDIFDYYTDEVGKPTGHDLQEGKVTLPLLHVLLKDGLEGEVLAEQQRMRALVSGGSLGEDEIAILIAYARTHGGIEYAEERMTGLIEEAIEIVERYAESDYKASLLALCRYIGQRRY